MTFRIQIVPIDGFRLFGALVSKEIDLYRKKQGTFFRSGPKTANRAKWSHKSYPGWVNLEKSVGEVVCVEIRSRQKSSAEWQLVRAFVGFLARHFTKRIRTINIHFH